MVNISVYKKTDCPKCDKLIEFLDKKGIQYEKLVIDKDADALKNAVFDKVMSVPAIKNNAGQVLKNNRIFDPNGSINEIEVTKHIFG